MSSAGKYADEPGTRIECDVDVVCTVRVRVVLTNDKSSIRQAQQDARIRVESQLDGLMAEHLPGMAMSVIKNVQGTGTFLMARDEEPKPDGLTARSEEPIS